MAASGSHLETTASRLISRGKLHAFCYCKGMSEAAAEALPNDIATLHALVLQGRAETSRLQAAVRHHELTIEKLKLQLARLRRMQFGRSSEIYSAAPTAAANARRRSTR